jgi:hypothetical protein
MSDHLQGLERHHDFVIFDVIANQYEDFLLRHKGLQEYCDRSGGECAARNPRASPTSGQRRIPGLRLGSGSGRRLRILLETTKSEVPVDAGAP